METYLTRREVLPLIAGLVVGYAANDFYNAGEKLLNNTLDKTILINEGENKLRALAALNRNINHHLNTDIILPFTSVTIRDQLELSSGILRNMARGETDDILCRDLSTRGFVTNIQYDRFHLEEDGKIQYRPILPSYVDEKNPLDFRVIRTTVFFEDNSQTACLGNSESNSGASISLQQIWRKSKPELVSKSLVVFRGTRYIEDIPEEQLVMEADELLITKNVIWNSQENGLLSANFESSGYNVDAFVSSAWLELIIDPRTEKTPK